MNASAPLFPRLVGAAVERVQRRLGITDRRALLAELSRSREQLDEAQATAHIGSYELDLASGELTWSRQMYELLGADPSTFTPTLDGFLGYIVDQDREAAVSATRDVQEGKPVPAMDFRAHRPDGSIMWLRGLGRLTLGDDGRPLRIHGTVQDVTEVKESELQLLDSVILNAMMQVMASAANEAATLRDALAVTRSQLLAHDDWGRAVGFSVVRGDGELALEPYLLSEDDEEAVPSRHERAIAERVLATGGIVFEEHTQPTAPSIGLMIKLGTEPHQVVVITACSPFERHEMLRSMVTQVSDQLGRVAERERAARELGEARDAALEASRLKSEFLATMSHEIRTPMNGVIGLNELLMRTDLDPQQKRLARGMQIAGQSLLGLITDILDFSKIEAGELELESVDFDVRSVFDQVTEILGAAASDKEIALTVRVADDVPARLVGDPTRLGQVVSNLTSNAVKFTSQGRVDVEVELDPSDGEGDADTVALHVRVVDTGIGISPEQTERLFEPFRQADASTTRVFGGTGLGLAIARQVVAALGGEIGVTSELGMGSTFWFTARFTAAGELADGELLASTWSATGDEHERRGHVLVVEDNEINQLVAMGLLEALGYTADLASDGGEAVAMAKAATYDAVLMDLQMPGMDGFEASRLIRAAEPIGFRMPIVAMTASAIDGERERCLASGMDDFLTKPVDSSRLEAVLRGRRQPGAEPTPDEDLTPRPPVDLSRLQELLDLGAEAAPLVERAIENFVAQLPQQLDAIATAVRLRDSDLLRQLAHRLRGSALNLGALRFADVALAVESHADADAAENAERLLPQLRETAAEAVAVLDDYRSSRVAT